MESRVVKQSGYVYLIDEATSTAWIKKGRIGRRKKYRVPSQMCENLEYVDLPSTLRQLDKQAFYGCRSLKRIINRSDVILNMPHCITNEKLSYDYI